MAMMSGVKKGIKSFAAFIILELVIIAFYLMCVGAFRDPQEPLEFTTGLAASLNGMDIYDFSMGLFMFLTFFNFFGCFILVSILDFFRR